MLDVEVVMSFAIKRLSVTNGLGALSLVVCLIMLIKLRPTCLVVG